MKRIVVIGAGAAGMMAAIAAADKDTEVLLLEKNEKAGKKLYITGKGRCNLTNACDKDTFFRSVVRNSRFLYGAYSRFSGEDAMRFFEDSGVPLKVERGNRVFPVSDHASDITRALTGALKKRRVRLCLQTEVVSVGTQNGRVTGLTTGDGRRFLADAIIIATGGRAYPQTGSTGSGYRFAKAAGHTVLPVRPSLVPLRVKETFIAELAGLSLRNVRITVRDGEECLYTDFGEMLFTHTGVSGPLILSASALVGDALQQRPLSLLINLKPALNDETLKNRLLRELDRHARQQFIHAVASLFPARLLPVIVALSGVAPQKKAADITREERLAFQRLIRAFPLTLTALAGFEEAVITRGGVSVKETDAKTMMSKKCAGLFFAGEVLDVDALTGGHNLQIAWTTGMAAGEGAKAYVQEREKACNPLP